MDSSRVISDALPFPPIGVLKGLFSTDIGFTLLYGRMPSLSQTCRINS